MVSDEFDNVLLLPLYQCRVTPLEGYAPSSPLFFLNAPKLSPKYSAAEVEGLEQLAAFASIAIENAKIVDANVEPGP